MRLVRTIIQLYHCVKYSSLYRFQTVSNIRQSTGCNNAHGIVDIKGFHSFLQIDLMNLIENLIVHSLPP